MSKNYINVRITVAEIKELLKPVLLCKDSDKLADVIIGNVSKNSVGLEQLYKSILGMFPECPYRAGQWVYVNVDEFYIWQIDREETKKLPHILNNTYLPIEIESVDMYSNAPIKAKATIMKTGSSKQSVETVYAEIDSITGIVEDLAAFIENMEESNQEIT